MRHIVSFGLLLSSLFFIGCNTSYDDSAVWDEFAEINERLERLEEQCNQMNTNLVALQNIVQALMNHDFVTNISPIITDGKSIGYTITFSKSGSITILNGTDGEDGHTPLIGVKQASDGDFYWTIDGEWLHDEDGNKIKASTAANNEDGITPKLKIEDGWWYVSYDGGDKWERLGKAYDTQSSNTIFSSITQDNENVYFNLTDGTTISIPRYISLKLNLDLSNIERFEPNTLYEIPYSVEGSNQRVEIEVSSSADILAKVVADNYKQLEGSIMIQTGEKLTEYSKVIVFASSGQSVVMQTITFEDDKLQILNESTKHITKEGGKITLDFMTNVEHRISIPETAQNWISVAEKSRAVLPHSITLDIKENKGSTRSAIVTIEATSGTQYIEFNIIQDSANPNQPSANELWYTSSDKQIITPYNTAAFGANVASNVYDSKHGVIQFDRAISAIGEQAFMNASQLTGITLSESITKIGKSAFRRCSELTEFVAPNSLEKIESGAFLRCEKLSTLILQEGLISIGDDAFAYCLSLSDISLPASLQTIGYGAFANCTALKSISLHGSTPPALSDKAFQNISAEAIIYVPANAVDRYKAAPGWKSYAQMIVGQDF